MRRTPLVRRRDYKLSSTLNPPKATTTVSYLDHFSADRADKVYVEVLNLLQVKKLYRQPGITARQIAEMMGEDYRAISAALAIEAGENFLTLLGRLRVREACRLLRDPRHAEKSIEQIGLKAGFASRQAFYLAFNRFMDVTPKEYRQQHARPAAED